MDPYSRSALVTGMKMYRRYYVTLLRKLRGCETAMGRTIMEYLKKDSYV